MPSPERTSIEARLRIVEDRLEQLVQENLRLKGQVADARSKLLQGAGGGQQVGFRPGEIRHAIVGVGGIDAAADEDNMASGAGLLRIANGSGVISDTTIEIDIWNKSVYGPIAAGAEIMVALVDGLWTALWEECVPEEEP